MPSDATVIVDVSNITEKQMRSLLDEGMQPVLVSTQKTFNYKEATDKLPRSILGTAWFVLRVPHVRDDGRIRTSAYDGRRFRHMEPRKSSPHVRYHHNSKCSISDEKRRLLTSNPTHGNCELDDVVIAELASLTGLPVATNDRELQKIVVDGRAPSIHRAMRVLMGSTTLTKLTRTKRGWKD